MNELLVDGLEYPPAIGASNGSSIGAGGEAITYLEELLAESVEFHGHLCPGQVLGVRMALAGCRHVEVGDPRKTRNLIVYVEIDRCATDAIQAVTGCKLGKRTLKYLDYGKMAASFLNTTTGQAVRVLARDDARERAWAYAPSGATKKEAQLEAYKKMPEEDLFVINPVRLELPEQDLPGPPLGRVTCDRCGEGINDRREVRHGEYTWCRACANGAYYQTTGFAPRRFELTARRVVAVVGSSNSGKTRVAGSLVDILTCQGYRVGAIKHCPHGHDIDRNGSDTDHFYSSGATWVMASSPDKRTTFEKVDHDASLESLTRELGPELDIVIAEGFKASTVPKILVLNGQRPSSIVGNVIATVGQDQEAGDLPHYTFEDLEELAARITEDLLTP